MRVQGFDLDNLARTYVQTTPTLAPYRKTITNVVGLALAGVGLLVTIPTEWLPPSWGVPIAVGAWAVTNVATYLVPANAATEAQRQAAANMLDRERAEAAALAAKQVVTAFEYGRHASRDGVTGPDGSDT